MHLEIEFFLQCLHCKLSNLNTNCTPANYWLCDLGHIINFSVPLCASIIGKLEMKTLVPVSKDCCEHLLLST